MNPQTFPQRTEGSVKKHWYKVLTPSEILQSDITDQVVQDMHYAEFAEDEVSFGGRPRHNGRRILICKQSAALLAAIKEYDANKWKAIGQKVGKPAKVGPDAALWIPSL